MLTENKKKKTQSNSWRSKFVDSEKKKLVDMVTLETNKLLVSKAQCS